MAATNKKLSIRDRVVAVLNDERPDRIPFIDRIEFWYKNRIYEGTMPEEYKGMSESEVHRAVGIGQEKWRLPYVYKYHGVEVISKIGDEPYYHEIAPELDFFPAIWDLIPDDRPGITRTEYVTPVGTLTVEHEMLEKMIATGTRPYFKKRPVVEEADYRILEYVIEHAEYIPRYDEFYAEETDLGDHGFLVPNIERVPFQTLLLDIVGEIQFFYDLYDRPGLVERLLRVLDAQVTEKLEKMADFDVPLVEFVDNLDGSMTNPRLFEKYSLPAYQRYADILHKQNKKMGSHTDGNLKPLVDLIAECGLDISESFTPTPITELPFAEAWETWKDGPIIWGGIPSYYLQEDVDEEVFQDYLEDLLTTIGDRPIILGVGDAVMSDNMIDRVQYIARRVEDHLLE
jgi:hypothetical protein